MSAKYKITKITKISELSDFQGVSVCLRDRHGNVFLLHNKKLDVLTFPGGWIEAHETPEQAAIREVREELGIV